MYYFTGSAIDDNPFFSEAKQEALAPADAKTLFGDSDDSDWDDLAGGLFYFIDDQT